MIARITGTIVEILERAVIVETNGVGYLINTASVTGNIGDTTTLHTHLVIKDDAHELFGFVSPEEKSLFTTLIGVSGVGPRTGLQMLMLYPINDLVRAIKNGDSKAISLVPGIGKKTAEKVIIDLKDKLANFIFIDETPKSDLVEALLSLGYKDTQVRDAIITVSADLPLSKQIAHALQFLAK